MAALATVVAGNLVFIGTSNLVRAAEIPESYECSVCVKQEIGEYACCALNYCIEQFETCCREENGWNCQDTQAE
jgi:hypothetical protein